MMKLKKQNPPMPESFENILTPKHPGVFFTKIASKQPLLKARWIL
jgi:hypothetical protein